MPISENDFNDMIVFASKYNCGSITLSYHIYFRYILELMPDAECTFHPHIHETYEIIKPLEGKYECKLNGNMISVPRDTILVIQPDDLHEDYFHKHSKFLSLTFTVSARELRNIFSDKQDPRVRIINLTQTKVLRTLLDEMQQTVHCQEFSLGYLEGLCQAFFWKISDNIPNELLAEGISSILEGSNFKRRLLSILWDHLYNYIDIDEIAKTFGISKRKLYTLCKKNFGASPIHIFQNIQMREAADLLAGGDFKILDIAQRFGFGDPYHFSRAFKRHMGKSPKNFIKSTNE